MCETLRHMKRLVVVLGMLVSVLTGCPGQLITVNGVDVYQNYWNQTLEELKPRVSFDLGCPGDQAQFTLFKRTGRHPTEVGAIACGKRAMYVRAVGRGGIGPWVLNMGSEAQVSTVAPQPPPPPPPPPMHH
jgi:hypothetical protein